MTPKQIFLAAALRQKTERQAVGSATSMVTADLMDHAGAAFPGAHLDPEKMALLAGAGHTILGFDNIAPLFSVWHESSALGCKVDWGKKNLMPGCREPLLPAIETLPSIPRDLLKRPGCATPLSAIALLRKRFSGACITGKVFGPWTLGYHVYGVENFLMQTLLNPDAIKRAMRKLIEVTLAFGRAQIEAGADTLTLADHCTRDLCSPDAYRAFLLEIHAELTEKLPCPLLLHICGDTSDRIPFIAGTGVAVFHFDSKVPAGTARGLAGEKMALMGGTSNFTVVREGTPEIIRQDVADKKKNRIDIIGPECAVPLDAPFRNLKLLAEEGKASQPRV